MLHIAIQGREASFHAIAARQYFGSDIVLIPCNTFTDVINQVGTCDYGIVAVENSVSGPVHEINRPDTGVSNLVAHAAVEATDEITIPIEQCLITLPGAKLDDITAIYSHDAALKQCSTFLDARLPHATRIEHEDTAGAAADIKAWDDPHNAAIASQAAAAMYDLDVAAINIGNSAKSTTRFLILSPLPQATRTRRKIESPSAATAAVE